MANNKIILGDEVLLDLTEDTVTEDTLSEGVTAHDASGKAIVGTGKSGGASSWNDLTEKPFETVGSDFNTSNDELQLSETVKESLGKADTALQSYEETDPTVPSHVKAITEQDIAKWNEGGVSTWDEISGKPFDLLDIGDFSTETLFGHTTLKINQTIKTQIASAIGSAANVSRELVGVKASLERCQETADDAYSKAESVEAQIGDVESLLAAL